MYQNNKAELMEESHGFSVGLESTAALVLNTVNLPILNWG